MQSGLIEEAKPGFAVDSKDNFYVGVATEGFEGEQENPLLAEIAAEWTEDTGQQFAVVAKLDGVTGDVLDYELDDEYTAAVAVNPKDEPANEVDELNTVYADNLANLGGEDATTVAAFNSSGELIQRFQAPGLRDGDGIAVDSETGAVYVADGAADKVDVFELEPPAPPRVSDLSACTLGGAESGCPAAEDVTTLKAQVNPEGAATHYQFEYGDGSCAAVPSPCTATEEKSLGKGFGEQPVSEQLPSLPTGLYHYRVVATNEFGTTDSAEGTFTILASASKLPDGREWELVSPPNKDGAEPESITREGGVIQASAGGEAITYVADGPMPAEAEPEGARGPEFTQVISTRDPEKDEWVSQDVSTPNERGSGIETGVAPEYQFFSPNLALALVEPFPEGEGTGQWEKPPLAPPVSNEEEKRSKEHEGKEYQEKTLYLRDDQPLQPEEPEVEDYKAAKENGEKMKNPGYLALVTELNAPGDAAFGGGFPQGVKFSGATPDLSHAVFASFTAAPGLYETGWPEGELRLVSQLPEAEGEKRVPPENPREASHSAVASLGGASGSDVRHAISNDGALVFWEAGSGTEKHLYVRDTVTQKTLKLDAVRGGSGTGAAEAVFQTASADGSKVFFTDTQRLTAESRASEVVRAKPDLYVAELSGGRSPGSPLSYSLTDLTPEGTKGESADVQVLNDKGNGVLGASEDGSYVYFVADGALAPGATRGDCSPAEEETPPGATCNLYMRHYNGSEWTPTKLIAVLSTADAPDWGGLGEVGDLAFVTSQVSPNGEYLAFMSDRSLTGYDNEDVTSKAKGERLDEEVFLYDASTERLVCASCNPTGARPEGVDDLGEHGIGLEEAEGLGLVVDRREVWAPATSTAVDNWLAGSVPGWTSVRLQAALYQSRYLSDSGRLFFDSPDHLVPASKTDKEKVYEYEPNGVGSCHSEAGCVGLISSPTAKHESAFLDASANGNDVFFLTAERLVQQDVDESFDVYDARVCEPSSPCLTAPAAGSPPCEETVENPCRGPAVGHEETFPPPASTTSSGSGNLPQQQVLSVKVAVTPPPPPKPLTRAQQLAKALKVCKADKKKSKRVACESRARKKYGPKTAAKAKKSSGKGKGR